MSREGDLEDTIFVFGHLMRVTVPAIFAYSSADARECWRQKHTEVSDQIRSQSIWSPFAVDNIAVAFDVEAEFFEALRRLVSTCISYVLRVGWTHLAERRQASFMLVDVANPFMSFLIASLQSVLERFEPLI